MLVIPYKPVHVLVFSQPSLKGNGRRYGNHLPKEIPDEKHVSVAESVRAKKFGFLHIFWVLLWFADNKKCKPGGTSSDNEWIASLLKILKITFYCLGRTLGQVVLHRGEFLGVLLYRPLFISFLNQRYFPITNSCSDILLCFGQVNPERNSVCH